MKSKKTLFVIASFTLVLSGCGLIKDANSKLARWNNDLEQEWIIQDANKRLSNYEWFYDQYGIIKSTASKVKLTEGEEQKATQLILIDMVEAYNSRSKQSMTRALWKAPDLPYQINITELLGE
ncbi:MAG: hypothetical protein E7059_08015 [Treponema bryantii]|nr:hypothetical protein [Treponema bryantii]